MKLLIDTNVLIDFIAQREPFCEQWDKLYAMQMMGDAELWLSNESLTNAAYILKGPLGAIRAQEILEEFLQEFPVSVADQSDLLLAAQRRWGDYEDAVVAICAEKIKADYIITRDQYGFIDSAIPAYSPEAFFNMLEKEYGVVYATEGLS